jgi:polynucleotide 5'-hydroxyl-kinase GRC3/NOL9
MITKLILQPGQIVRLNGPLKARVVQGQVLVLGAIFNTGNEFHVDEYRSYALKALTEANVELNLMQGGSIENPLPDEEVIDEWVSIADNLLRNDCTSIVVIGPTDAGKTSIAALVANRALLRGYRVAVIDADIGQADIGPPATVSASFVTSPILWLRSLRAEYMRFIGSITPQRNERRIVAAVVSLAEQLRKKGADVIIVDTDGWIQGINSIEYKVEIVRFINADAVIVVGDSALFDIVSTMLGGLKCRPVFMKSPRVRRERSREDRRVLRSMSYQRYLEPLYERKLFIGRISIFGSCFFSGRRVDTNDLAKISEILKIKVVAASETVDTLYVVTDGQPQPQMISRLAEMYGKQVYVLDLNVARNALLALIDKNGEEKAIGILKDIDFENNVITVLTPYTGEIRGIVLGSIRLAENYEEVGRPVRCVI